MPPWRIVLLLIMLVVPGASAQHLLGASLEATIDLDVTRMQVVQPEGRNPGSLLDGPGCRDAGTIQADADLDAFTFSEGIDQAGCAEMVADFLVPEGASGFRVVFDFDRNVEPDDGFAVPNMRQVLSIRDEGGDPLGGTNLVEGSIGSLARSTRSIPATAPVGIAGFVSWGFYDDGAPSPAGALPDGQNRLIASVWDPHIVFDPIPIPQAATTTVEPVVRGNDVLNSYDVRTVLTEPMLRSDAQEVLALHMFANVEVAAVSTPAGPLALDRIQVEERGDELIIRIPADVLAAAGPGTYSVGFVTTTSRDTVLAGFAYFFVFVPGLVAVTAVLAARRIERGVRPGLRTVLREHPLLAVGIAVYVGLLSWVLLTRRVDLLAVLPLPVQSWLIYAVLLVLLLLFIQQTSNAVGARTRRRELERMHELERSNEELERFAYAAGHDLQEPLRKIISFTGLLQRRYDHALDTKANSYLTRTQESARRMRALIDDLLRYAQAGEGGRREAVDLAAIMEDVQADAKEMLDEAGGRLEVGLMPHVIGRRRPLHQVLYNLVGNAVKYRHPDRPPIIKVDAKRAGAEWRISIQDNGRGIRETDQDRIFGLFKRSEGRKETVEGTGIGLAVVQKVIHEHGGRVWVSSKPGRGSTFYFTLPVTHV